MCYRCDITFESYGELKNHSKVTHPLEFSLPHMDQHQDVIPIERYADPTDPNNGEPSSATSAPVMQEYSNPEIQAASTTLAVDAASRTLGFWPLPTSESTTTEHPITVPLPTPSSLLKCLEVFLSQILSIPLSTIRKMKYNLLFKDENNEILFVEFSTAREVNTVFKHVRNLPKGHSVCRYILPSMRDRYKALSERAFKLRKCTIHYQTKILYDEDNLCLYFKKPEDLDWTVDYNPCPAGPHPTSLDSPWTIPQYDGPDDLDVRKQPAQTSLPYSSQAPYYLNNDRHTARICKDATISDMNIIVNNNDTNVNIQCSTGFYIVVVKPCLAGISEGSVTQYPSVQVTCTELSLKTDKAGVPDFTRFSFNLKGSNLSPLETVCPFSSHYQACTSTRFCKDARQHHCCHLVC